MRTYRTGRESGLGKPVNPGARRHRHAPRGPSPAHTHAPIEGVDGVRGLMRVDLGPLVSAGPRHEHFWAGPTRSGQPPAPSVCLSRGNVQLLGRPALDGRSGVSQVLRDSCGAYGVAVDVAACKLVTNLSRPLRQQAQRISGVCWRATRIAQVVRGLPVPRPALSCSPLGRNRVAGGLRGVTDHPGHTQPQRHIVGTLGQDGACYGHHERTHNRVGMLCPWTGFPPPGRRAPRPHSESTRITGHAGGGTTCIEHPSSRLGSHP